MFIEFHQVDAYSDKPFGGNPAIVYRFDSWLVKTFRRNPDVVAEIQLRANGTCEGCRLPTPLERPDGSLYLEAHHVKRLADGGYDRLITRIQLTSHTDGSTRGI